MKLIADSGSTKTDWILLNDNTTIYNTIGLNPVFVDEKIVKETVLKSDFIVYKNLITEIYFFGAGCSTDKRKGIIKDSLSDIFTNAKINIDTDLLGAGLAMFGKTEGIIGILGTGSNTGFYKNCKIEKNISSLGYILGDEGSGTHIGKEFIKVFLNNELPEKIKNSFVSEYKLNLNDIITKVYKQPFPNRFLASFVPFVYKHKSEEKIKELLKKCFNDFFNKTILKYKDYQNKEIKLIGSVAHYFADEIKDNAKALNISITEISKSPTQGLIDFYK